MHPYLKRQPGRITSLPGYRFEATQALRQVLARAVVWGTRLNLTAER